MTDGSRPLYPSVWATNPCGSPGPPCIMGAMTSFTSWVQQKLADLGYNVSVDGAFGPQTRSALLAFQAKRNLTPSGLADAPTVTALRALHPVGVASTEPPSEILPPWADELYRRMGLHESRNTGKLIEFLKAGRYLGDPRRNPWCGDAVETAFARTLTNEPLPANPFWAQAWSTFGREVPLHTVGAVCPIRWSAKSGHVGFVVGWSKGRIHLLGGNQSNSICIRSFPERKVIDGSGRWPSTVPIQTYAPLVGDGVASSGKEDTR